MNHTYKRRKGKTRITPRSVERIRGEKIPITSICTHPKQPNISGNVLEQLIEEYCDKTVEPYPGTLVVLVANNIDKLFHTLNLYYLNKPTEPHDLALVYNGGNDIGFVDTLPVAPENCICEPIMMKNWGWDLGMYAEVVLQYKYSRYFFINDDVIHIGGNKWISEFESEVAAGAGLVGIQGHYFIRTSYYGATRLFWLAFLTSILSDCVQFSHYRLRRMFPRIRRSGAIDAFCFEAIGKFFADRCGFKIGWVKSPHQFLDRNCIRYKNICASQWKDKPVPYFIDRLGNGLEEKISVDYVINWARQHGLRDIH